MDNYKYGRIIIEPHTYCNRSCNFCLMKYIDKKYKNNIFYMSDKVLNKILNFILNNIQYFKTDDLTFSLFKYNEPLYDIDNLIYVSRKIKQFFNERKISTYLFIHTNGDFLNKNNIDKIMLNIDEMRINDYQNSGFSKIMEKIYNLSPKIKFKKYVKEKNDKDKILCSYENKSIIFYINSSKDLHKTSRGSIVLKNDNDSYNWVNDCKERDFDCDSFNTAFIVEYDGTIFPCSELSIKIEKHKELSLGNILEYEYVYEFENNKVNDYKKYISCKYCQMSLDFCPSIIYPKKY